MGNLSDFKRKGGKILITLRLKTHFDAAHYLPHLPPSYGCGHMHGHTWWVEVEISGDPDKNGIVVDFTEVKDKINKFDHQLLNDFIEAPTAENIAKEIYEMIPGCISCTVWESENASATYREE